MVQSNLHFTMIIVQWVLNSLTVDAQRQNMKDFYEFNINRTNSDGLMMIHDILYTVNLISRSVITNIKIDLENIRSKYFEKNMSLANEQFKGLME